jgi:hypothetical protein
MHARRGSHVGDDREQERKRVVPDERVRIRIGGEMDAAGLQLGGERHTVG